MKRNELGHTGLYVSELSLGTLILSKLQARLTIEESALIIKKALDLGINFIDSGTSYATQEHIREGLKGAKDKVVISTKTRQKTYDLARKDFENSLRELGRDTIDLYQLHIIESAQDLAERRGVLEFLLECKQRGLIRAIGASVHNVEPARAIVAEPEIDVIFPILNHKGLGIMDGSINDMIQVCHRAEARGMGIMVMKPLGGGHLRKSAREAFDFIQRLGIADSICVGMKSIPEVECNVNLIEGRNVSREILAQLETVSRRIIINHLCKGCGNCLEACAQGALSIDVSTANIGPEKKGQAVVDRDKCILCGYCVEVCPAFSIRVV
jgi:aryl-alcohol dehydrogenase-like predicted oxidoreductase